MFCFRDRAGRIDVAFTDRHGGASAGSFASLNLGGRGGDPMVETNLGRVADAFGTARDRIRLMRQVHGADVVTVRNGSPPTDSPMADAMVTDEVDLTLLVRVADCVPVLLADVDAGVVGCAHAGRAGLAAGVVSAAVAAMQALGATQLTAWVGPHVCGKCYEVPEAMRHEVAAVVPEAQAVTSWGTPSLDIGAGVHAQLVASGCTVVDISRCTRESPDLYSHRRDGAAAGRSAGLIRVRPAVAEERG